MTKREVLQSIHYLWKNPTTPWTLKCRSRSVLRRELLSIKRRACLSFSLFPGSMRLLSPWKLVEFFQPFKTFKTRQKLGISFQFARDLNKKHSMKRKKMWRFVPDKKWEFPTSLQGIHWTYTFRIITVF